MRTLLLLLLLTTASYAVRWSQHGNQWTCSNGITMGFPAEYKVSEGRLDSLSVDGEGCQITVIPADGPSHRQQGIDGILGMFKSKHVDLEKNWDTRSPGKTSVKVRR